jgi:ABC-type transport system involved in multi-copper enzyme maturation permease subunit
MNLSLLRYILMAAGRDKFFISLIGVIVIVIALSVFFGSSAITEQTQFASTFAAFGFRLFGVVALVFFVIGYIRRCFDNRDIDYLLSRPVGRIEFILTHAAAFSVLALVAALLLGGTTVLIESRHMHSGIWLWWLSLAVEFVIMVNVAMFFAFVMTSWTACMLVVFSFYLLSRLIGEIIGILTKGAGEGVFAVLGKVMEIISIFIPRLDLMGQTKRLLYGVPPELSLPFVMGQGAVFTALVIGATCLDMHKRQF